MSFNVALTPRCHLFLPASFSPRPSHCKMLMLFPSTATFSAQEEITCHRKVRTRLVSRQPLLGSETICKVRDFSCFSIYRSYVPLLWKPPSRSIEVGTWQDFQGHVREAVDHPALKVPAMRVIYVQLERLGSFSMGS